ncbi:hypothetical protein OIU78_022527 [Salix suchowensis]|nr:hypothetical protein OIU78_022527 [Salix suchowensis]
MKVSVLGHQLWGVPGKRSKIFGGSLFLFLKRYATEGTSYQTFQRQLSEASNSKVSSVPDSESVSSALEEEDKRIDEVEEGDFHHDGAEITPGDFEDHHEVDSCLSESEGATPKELNPSEILLRMETGEEDCSSRSSLSSLSEIDEKITDVKRGSMCLEPEDFQIECSHISSQTSLDSDFRFIFILQVG